MSTPPTRYALLRHECPPGYRDGPHWDLMLEREAAEAEHRLATWSLLTLPAAWAEALGLAEPPARGPLAATGLPDHRVAYLEYEGGVSGGRGAVARLATGSVEWIEGSHDRVGVRLLDGPLRGRITLVRERGDEWALTVGPSG